MRFFIDANVLISAILFPEGKSAAVLDHILETHTPVLSSYTIRECQRVFEKKFPTKQQKLTDFLNETEFETFRTPNTIDPSRFPAIRDVADLPVLASAIISDSDILLTGDKDFQDVRIQKPLILTPTDYYDLIDS